MNELPNSPAGLMHLMPSTASQINSFANGIVQAVRRGEENPLDVLLQVRAMEKALKIILDNIKPFAEKEADKYPGDKFDFKGNEVSKTDVKTEYDYAVSKDPVYERLLYEYEKTQKELKEREAFLKVIKDFIFVADPETGELVTVRPPLKKTTSGLKISIK